MLKITTSKSDPTTNLAVRLRLLRLQMGWTQSELAEKSGLHFVTVSRIETGIVKPFIGSVRALADALGVSVPELVSSIDDLAEVHLRRIEKT